MSHLKLKNSTGGPWGIIPTCSNLVRKRVPISPQCPRCGENETNMHVLRDCWWARSFWEEVGIDLLQTDAFSFRSWCEWVYNTCTSDRKEVFATLVWQLWTARNEYNFEKIHTPPQACIRRALIWLKEYKK